MLRLKHQRLQNEQIQSALRKFDSLCAGHASLLLLQEEYTISCRSASGVAILESDLNVEFSSIHSEPRPAGSATGMHVPFPSRLSFAGVLTRLPYLRRPPITQRRHLGC